MNTSHMGDKRFSLDEKRYVVDVLNPSNSGKGYCHDGAPEDQRYLRERVRMVCLGELVDALFGHNEPMETGFMTGEQYRPFSLKRHLIWRAIEQTIKASHFDALDPTQSMKNRFSGTLNRRKRWLTEYTSLALFVDDVERLLRDLYGGCGEDALNELREALLAIVKGFAMFAANDLWQEFEKAEDADIGRGAGLPEGYGISSSQFWRGIAAEKSLAARARAVRADSASFSKYTVEFADGWATNDSPNDLIGDPLC